MTPIFFLRKQKQIKRVAGQFQKCDRDNILHRVHKLNSKQLSVCAYHLPYPGIYHHHLVSKHKGCKRRFQQQLDKILDCIEIEFSKQNYWQINFGISKMGREGFWKAWDLTGMIFSIKSEQLQKFCQKLHEKTPSKLLLTASR